MLPTLTPCHPRPRESTRPNHSPSSQTPLSLQPPPHSLYLSSLLTLLISFLFATLPSLTTSTTPTLSPLSESFLHRHVVTSVCSCPSCLTASRLHSPHSILSFLLHASHSPPRLLPSSLRHSHASFPFPTLSPSLHQRRCLVSPLLPTNLWKGLHFICFNGDCLRLKRSPRVC